MATNLSGMCRGCMSVKNLQPLFDENLDHLYRQLTALELSPDDGLSTMMCSSCVALLNQHNTFRLRCIETVEILRKRHRTFATLSDCTLNIGDSNLEQRSSCEAQDQTVATAKGYGNDKASKKLGQMKKTSEVDGTAKKNIADCWPSQTINGLVPSFIAPHCSKSSDIDEKIIVDDKTITQADSHIKLSKEYDPRKNFTFPYRCAICNRGFRYKERFEGHMREHEGKRAAVCELCGREYSKWSGLQNHAKRMHKDKMKYSCHCGKQFMYESGLLTHRMSHNGPRQLVCENCGKTFPDAYQLNKHYLVHQIDTPFGCGQCSKRFKSAFHLRAHEFRHMGIRNFTCQTCGKSVATRPELRSHMRVHSTDKSFVCHVCSKQFRHSSQVATHMRTHTGDKPYKCDVCSKSFTCPNSRKIHLRIHTGEKPYQCKLCQRTFAQASVLKTHMKIHSNEQSSLIEGNADVRSNSTNVHFERIN